jgi:hypothetical protein
MADLILKDGVLCRIDGFANDHDGTTVDLTTIDNKHTWCFWPSPRLTQAPADAVFPDLPVWTAPMVHNPHLKGVA